MVVADSRANAVRYYLAIKRYITDHQADCVGTDVMIAFSGEVTLEDYPSEKPFTEASMNTDENGKYITTDIAVKFVPYDPHRLPPLYDYIRSWRVLDNIVSPCRILSRIEIFIEATRRTLRICSILLFLNAPTECS